MLTKIDRLLLPQHYYLDEDDECYFMREYISRGGYGASETNQLIANLKKSPNKKGTSEWFYKEEAIKQCSRELRNSLTSEWIQSVTFVPVPPSKARGDDLHDDRIEQVLLGMAQSADVRPLIRQLESRRASHESDDRPSPHSLIENYEIDENLAAVTPDVIAVFDDVITAGTHYRACHDLLSKRFPRVPLCGIFISRRIFADEC